MSLTTHCRINDTTVPYATAGIDNIDPFANRHESGLIVYVLLVVVLDKSLTNVYDREMDEKYPAIVKSYTIPEIPPVKTLKPRPFTIAWLRTFKPMQILPPPLQFRFPLNVVSLFLSRLYNYTRTNQSNPADHDRAHPNPHSDVHNAGLRPSLTLRTLVS